MNTVETIHARRSVRSYLPEPVSEATVLSLLRDAVHAPSAMNAQPWLFAVVQDRDQLKRYSDRAKQLLRSEAGEEVMKGRYGAMLSDESFNIFYDAGTLIVIGCHAPTRFARADCWLAAGTLMLSARAAGLGTCCIGFALDLLNTQEIRAELGFPATGEVVAAIILGYPVELPAPVARATPTITAWLGQAGAKTKESQAQLEAYMREHPAGYLATSRTAPSTTERAAHSDRADDPGLGPFGRRILGEGERELTLSTPLPEEVLSRIRAKRKKGT